MRLILLRHQVPKIEYHVPYFTACIGTGSEPVRFWFWGLRTGSQIGTGSGNRAISDQNYFVINQDKVVLAKIKLFWPNGPFLACSRGTEGDFEKYD